MKASLHLVYKFTSESIVTVQSAGEIKSIGGGAAWAFTAGWFDCLAAVLELVFRTGTDAF